MSMAQQLTGIAGGIKYSAAAFEYWLDRTQRTILFWDVLRKRGNNYIEHLKAGQPPVLIFDYEMVLDGRTFDQPVNYSLIRILDRRGPLADPVTPSNAEKRKKTEPSPSVFTPPSRPIVVIDPRAGHGPGIGGSKINSQIGVALTQGHPVYFIMFYTNPEPDQTIADVQQAEIRFLEEVGRRHPDAPKPAVIGNCQAGWAAALIGADRPDVAGPMVFNGSPLSYWGGVEGANPMRYKGGLCGGVWTTSLWCDLGNGKFDGAHLVAGFEDLNPANTYWKKLYNLFAKIDTEEERFLDFEKWWGGFFKMNTEEIHFIVDSLFIGNELEQGHLRLDESKSINLKNFKEPILIFASGGDNITPPPQALNWIKKVYGTVEEIKNQAQVVVYMVHKKVGHLGIFVSGNVARKEHREIIGSVDMVQYLSPGLYEMMVEGDPSHPELDDFTVRFEPRSMDDILQLDDGLEDEEAFVPVNAVSRFNDSIYQTFMRPWVRMGMTDRTAKTLRLLHPLRIQRYAFSDQNPFCLPVKYWAEAIKPFRRTIVSDDNPFLAWETVLSNTIEANLNRYRDLRDQTLEFWFKTLYGNPLVKMLFSPFDKTPKLKNKAKPVDKKTLKRREAWVEMAAVEGGFAEAVVRLIIAVIGANRMLDKRQFMEAEAIIRSNTRLSRLTPKHYKVMVKEQTRLLELNEDSAIDGLPVLLTSEKDRLEAIEIAERIATADAEPDKKEKAMLKRIRKILQLEPN